MLKNPKEAGCQIGEAFMEYKYTYNAELHAKLNNFMNKAPSTFNLEGIKKVSLSACSLGGLVITLHKLWSIETALRVESEKLRQEIISNKEILNKVG